MKDILTILKDASPIMVLIVVIAYFLTGFIEKRLEGLANRVDDIAKVSLDLKKDLRGEERNELVAFRVAVERWEYFLQTLLFDFTMLPPSKAKIAPLYEEDKRLFLDVKVAVVKASTYLRNQDLELQLIASIEQIRRTYYPLINEALPRLIDLQAKLIPMENKLSQFEESRLQNLSVALTEKDREEHLRVQTLMTDEIKAFSGKFLAEYRSIATQMHDLKQAINHYIYRPIEHASIDKD